MFIVLANFSDDLQVACEDKQQPFHRNPDVRAQSQRWTYLLLTVDIQIIKARISTAANVLDYICIWLFVYRMKMTGPWESVNIVVYVCIPPLSRLVLAR